MWIKICGNTNLEDAALAAELGADAVGFVFAPSKRQVTREQVAAITPHLPPTVERVGVFYSHDPEEIAQTAWHSGLTAIQLHGGLDDALSERLAERLAGSVRIIQTLHWIIDPHVDPHNAAPNALDPAAELQPTSAARLERQILHLAATGIADRVLIDSKVGAASGGTGVAFDWLAAREAFASAPSGLHLIVAGGLRPDNVARAIAQLQPWGVDVASGVEASPGRKDPARLAAFIDNARKKVGAP
jgi:phosphoribosylanthranilate isomerase